MLLQRPEHRVQDTDPGAGHLAHDPQPVELLRPVQGVGRAVTDQVLGERRRFPRGLLQLDRVRARRRRVERGRCLVRFDGLGDVEGDLTVDERGAQIGVAVEVADAAHVGRQMEHELGADDRADRLGERRQVGSAAHHVRPTPRRKHGVDRGHVRAERVQPVAQVRSDEAAAAEHDDMPAGHLLIENHRSLRES